MKKYFLLIMMVRLDWGKISLKTWNGIDMEVKNNETGYHWKKKDFLWNFDCSAGAGSDHHNRGWTKTGHSV